MVSNQSRKTQTILIVLVVVLSILLLLAVGCLFVLQGLYTHQKDTAQAQPSESIPPTKISTEAPTETRPEAPTETQPETQAEIPETLHEHAYTLLSETAPSCALEGAATYICSCGDSYSDPIPPTGHSPSSATCTKSARCSQCDEKVGQPLGHSFIDCVCHRCGLVEITLEQLQGTWKRISSNGYEIITVSGDQAEVEWCYGSNIVTFSGPVCLTDYGFYVQGTASDTDGSFSSYTIKTSCYIEKFTDTYFLDTFDNIEGPYIWHKQS